MRACLLAKHNGSTDDSVCARRCQSELAGQGCTVNCHATLDRRLLGRYGSGTTSTSSSSCCIVTGAGSDSSSKAGKSASSGTNEPSAAVAGAAFCPCGGKSAAAAAFERWWKLCQLVQRFSTLLGQLSNHCLGSTQLW